MSKTQEVIVDAGTYSSLLLLTQVVTIAAAILTRRFLGPVQMGVWSFAQVVLSYAEYASLGTLSAVTLQIPFYHGKGDVHKAVSIKNTVFTFSILTSLTLSAGVIFYACYRRQTFPKELFYGLLFTAALIILQRVNGLFISLIRAYKHFALAGKQMLYSALVNALLIAFLSYRFKLYGFLVAMCLSFIFNIVYIAKHEKFDFRVSLKKEELFALIGYGLPLMVIALMTTFFETIDRVMITKYLGFEALGLYGIGLMVFNFINSVPNALSIVVIPNLQEKYGKSENKADLKSFLNKSDFLVSGLISLMIGLAWIIVPLLVHRILPKFIPGIAAMRYLILGAYFIAIGLAYLQFIYVIKKHLSLLPFTALSCGAAFLFNWIALRGGSGIEGVAIATTLAIYCNFTAICIYASSHIFTLREFLKNYFFFIAKFVFLLVLLYLLHRFVQLNSPLWTVLLQALLFMAAYGPFLVESNRRFDLVSIIKQKLFGKKTVVL